MADAAPSLEATAIDKKEEDSADTSTSDNVLKESTTEPTVAELEDEMDDDDDMDFLTFLKIREKEKGVLAFQGWMLKRGEKGVKKWKNRWFAIGSNAEEFYFLNYYKASDDKEPIGHIAISATMTVEESPIADKEEHAELAFQLHNARGAEGRVYQLVAPSAEAKEKWLEAIRITQKRMTDRGADESGDAKSGRKSGKVELTNLSGIYKACLEMNWEKARDILDRVKEDEVNGVDETGKDGSTALWWASMCNVKDLVKRLVEHGADPTLLTRSDGTCAIHWLAHWGDTNLLQFVLTHCHTNLNGLKTTRQRTPLHWACGIASNVECVKALLNNGANVNASDSSGWSPLHCAAYMGNEAVVEFLLSKKAWVDVKDHENRTPLHIAAIGGHQRICSLLVAAGADKTLQDRMGETPLDRAHSYPSLFPELSPEAVAQLVGEPSK